MKNLKKVIYIGLYKPELEIVERIKNEKGLPIPEVIRSMIREYGEKQFPKERLYAENKKRELDLRQRTIDEQVEWDKLDPKEYVLNTLQGEVDEENGMALFIHATGGTDKIPLSEVKNADKTKFPLDDHLAIVNGTYVFPFGPSGAIPWSKEECASALRKWRGVVRKELGEEK